MVTYFKTTHANYPKGKISPTALTNIAKGKSPGRVVELLRVPAHPQG